MILQKRKQRVNIIQSPVLKEVKKTDIKLKTKQKKDVYIKKISPEKS